MWMWVKFGKGIFRPSQPVLLIGQQHVLRTEEITFNTIVN